MAAATGPDLQGHGADRRKQSQDRGQGGRHAFGPVRGLGRRLRLVIGVTNGTHTREELTPHPHTHLIGSLRELAPLVLAHDSGAAQPSSPANLQEP